MRRSILIKGKTWKIKRKRGLFLKGVGLCNGICDTSSRTITIDSSVKGDHFRRVFIHEFFHACIFELHLNEHGGIDPGIEEVLVEGLSDILNELLEWEIKETPPRKGPRAGLR